MDEPTYSCTNGTHHLACDCREAQFAHLLVKYNAEVNENKRLKKELTAKDTIIEKRTKERDEYCEKMVAAEIALGKYVKKWEPEIARLREVEKAAKNLYSARIALKACRQNKSSGNLDRQNSITRAALADDDFMAVLMGGKASE
jgi:uncharacterized metal-binding protein